MTTHLTARQMRRWIRDDARAIVHALAPDSSGYDNGDDIVVTIHTDCIGVDRRFRVAGRLCAYSARVGMDERQVSIQHVGAADGPRLAMTLPRDREKALATYKSFKAWGFA